MQLPPFVDPLLDQGPDARDVTDITFDNRDWLKPLVSGVLGCLVNADTVKAAEQSFRAHGYAHLALCTSAEGPYLYLRLAPDGQMAPWTVENVTVVLTLAGTVAVEMYRSEELLKEGPDYARSFGVGQVFCAHPEVQCATQSSHDGMQLAVSRTPAGSDAHALSLNEYLKLEQSARWRLEELLQNPNSPWGVAQ
ncbi:hypothetical protein [Streptomyces sp. BH105]|uniref:hypothetical protein n=1 Tax=Streptomyces sp. BH105 TaxID=3410408 RepID=UPI003CE7B47B